MKTLLKASLLILLLSPSPVSGAGALPATVSKAVRPYRCLGTCQAPRRLYRQAIRGAVATCWCFTPTARTARTDLMGRLRQTALPSLTHRVMCSMPTVNGPVSQSRSTVSCTQSHPARPASPVRLPVRRVRRRIRSFTPCRRPRPQLSSPTTTVPLSQIRLRSQAQDTGSTTPITALMPTSTAVLPLPARLPTPVLRR